MSCPDCFKGAIHTHADPTGSWSTTGNNMRTYVANPPTPSPTSSGSTILFLCDAFGPPLRNNLLLADSYARRTGHRVLIPDLLGPNWSPVSNLDNIDTIMTPPPSPWNIFAQLKRAFTVLKLMASFIPFLIIHHPKKHMTETLAYARSIKKELPAGAKLGVAGFCWGGWLSTALCAQPTKEGGSERLIDAQFTAHPSAMKPPEKMIGDAIDTYDVPYSMAIGDKDMGFPIKQVEETEAKVRERVGKGDGEGGKYWEFNIYPGAQHGFAVRAINEKRDGRPKSAEDAETQAVEWFKRFL
ncbi:MAG: hypothetical protein Q9227_006731 [Pyrenula ochraceoflavens]